MAYRDTIPIEAHHIGKQRCPEDWSLTPSNTVNWSDLDLWYLLDGYGDMQTPQGHYVLQPGVCLVMRGGQPYHFHRTSPQPLMHYYVHFSFLDTQGQIISPNSPPHMPLYRLMCEMGPLETLLDRALEAYRSPGQGGSATNLWLYAAILEITREDQQAHRQTNTSRVNHDHDIETLCKTILDEPAKHWNMKDFCQKLYCSRAHVYRRFKQHTGRSPQQFLIDTRMQAAHFLLLDSNLSISQIARRLGYADVYFFSRQFKQHHRVSPSTFRKSPSAVKKQNDPSEKKWQPPC